MPRLSFQRIATIGALVLLSAVAVAQEWPAKPVRIVVPFPPGGSTDVVARLIVQRLAERLNQQFVVENRPGAAGNIGTDAVAKATNLAEFIALVKANPGQYTVGHPGNGTIGHLALELMKSNAGADLTGVPYKGDTPALADLLGGQIDALSAPITAFIAHIQSGKLKGLAVTSKGRFPGLPQMQSATEQGIDVVATVWFAIVGPAGTPRAIVERMNSEVNQILASPEGKQKLDQFGLVMVGGAPEVLGTLMAAEAAKWKRVIDTTRISIE